MLPSTAEIGLGSPMSVRSKIILAVLISAIVIAHVFMWRSEMEPAMKLMFTVLNAAGWTIVLAPIFLVNKWIKAVEAKNADGEKGTS